MDKGLFFAAGVYEEKIHMSTGFGQNINLHKKKRGFDDLVLVPGNVLLRQAKKIGKRINTASVIFKFTAVHPKRLMEIGFN